MCIFVVATNTTVSHLAQGRHRGLVDCHSDSLFGREVVSVGVGDDLIDPLRKGERGGLLSRG